MNKSRFYILKAKNNSNHICINKYIKRKCNTVFSFSSLQALYQLKKIFFQCKDTSSLQALYQLTKAFSMQGH